LNGTRTVAYPCRVWTRDVYSRPSPDQQNVQSIRIETKRLIRLFLYYSSRTLSVAACCLCFYSTQRTCHAERDFTQQRASTHWAEADCYCRCGCVQLRLPAGVALRFAPVRTMRV
jgi:hypothetical protein